MIDEQSDNLGVTPKEANVPKKRIMNSIRFIRGQRVILDTDLAELYEVETGALTRAVRRNSDRFLDDFMFQLTKQEFGSLRSQTATSITHGNSCRSQAAHELRFVSPFWEDIPGEVELRVHFWTLTGVLNLFVEGVYEDV